MHPPKSAPNGLPPAHNTQLGTNSPRPDKRQVAAWIALDSLREYEAVLL